MATETPITRLEDAIAAGEVTLPIDWDPRPDQTKLWKYLVNGGKRAVEVAHRRWGKDDVALHWTCCAAMERVGNYWHMLPEYNQARKVVWTAVNPRTGKRRIDEAFPVWLRKKTLEQEMSVQLINGSIWQLVGSDNYNSLVGSPPVGIVFSEWALANPLAWAYLSPILEENKGWALFIYTSRGQGHGLTMIRHAQSTDGWFAEILPADKTPVFTPAQIETIKNDYQKVFGPELGEALFNQEYFCSFTGAQMGAYYAKQLEQARKDGRITSVPWQPSIEVHTFWDLGVDDSMSIWFMQQVGKEYRLIDYYENVGYGLEHYAKVLKDKSYVYGNHYMPHDADIREMTSGDVALSRKEVAENLGLKPIIVVERARNMNMIVQVHIPAARNIMAQCWWDEKKCALGLSALESYAAEYDEEKKVLSNRPAHNWSSHACLHKDTLVSTDKGEIRIKDIKPGAKVWTPRGYSKVLYAGPTGWAQGLIEVEISDGKIIKATADHKFLTDKGFIRAEELETGDHIFSGKELPCVLISWISTAIGLGYRESITGKTAGHRMDRATFIGRFGNFTMGLFQKAMKSITSTETPSITTSQILPSDQSENINESIRPRESGAESCSLRGNTLVRKRLSGMDLHKESNGTVNTGPPLGNTGNGMSVYAKSAANAFCRLILRGLSSAIPTVKAKHFVEIRGYVYDLTIEKHGCYRANGILVSNSDAFRTFAVGYIPIKKQQTDWREKSKHGSWRV